MGRRPADREREVRKSANRAGEDLAPDWWWDFSAESLAEQVPTPARDQFPEPVPVDTEYALAPDRLLAGAFVLVLTAALLAVFGAFAGTLFRSQLLAVVYVGLWAFVGVYAVSTAVWAYEAFLGVEYESPPLVYGPEDVQVRILTIDAEDVVQTTVDTLPDALTDRHVVAEAPIDIEGATVHVVPEEFDCEASDKGRALEWARRELPCEKEFVLFLDEDTLVTEFPGLPEADVVQFREWPMYTGSIAAYWAEVLRMGYQTEQTGFAQFDVPLYAWGGGIAVRSAVEDHVTWNFETLIEDTVFAWHAVTHGARFEVMETKFRNQAPPSLWAMFEQRRRWFVGTLRDEGYLPTWYRSLMTLRNVSWAFSPVTPFFVWFIALVPEEMPGSETFRLLAWVLFLFSLVWVWRGWRYYEGPGLRTLPVFVVYPFVVALHSAGAAWGLLSAPESFEPTAKAGDAESAATTSSDDGAADGETER